MVRYLHYVAVVSDAWSVRLMDELDLYLASLVSRYNAIITSTFDSFATMAFDTSSLADENVVFGLDVLLVVAITTMLDRDL